MDSWWKVDFCRLVLSSSFVFERILDVVGGVGPVDAAFVVVVVVVLAVVWADVILKKQVTLNWCNCENFHLETMKDQNIKQPQMTRLWWFKGAERSWVRIIAPDTRWNISECIQMGYTEKKPLKPSAEKILLWDIFLLSSHNLSCLIGRVIKVKVRLKLKRNLIIFESHCLLCLLKVMRFSSLHFNVFVNDVFVNNVNNV